MMRRYQMTESWLGTVLLAASPAGLCSLILADRPAAAYAELSTQFPGHTLESGDDPLFEAAMTHIDNPARPVHIPLDLQGTPFQREVWQALLDIPSGQTRSYADIARQIGKPTAFRAVARACGANPVAVLVPCHRVIGSNGNLTGYAGGLWRKRALLEREGSLPASNSTG